MAVHMDLFFSRPSPRLSSHPPYRHSLTVSHTSWSVRMLFIPRHVGGLLAETATGKKRESWAQARKDCSPLSLSLSLKLSLSL